MYYPLIYGIMLGNTQTKLQFEYIDQKSMRATQACFEDIMLGETSQSQYCMTPCGQVQRQKIEQWLPKASGEGGMENY